MRTLPDSIENQHININNIDSINNDVSISVIITDIKAIRDDINKLNSKFEALNGKTELVNGNKPNVKPSLFSNNLISLLALVTIMFTTSNMFFNRLDKSNEDYRASMDIKMDEFFQNVKTTLETQNKELNDKLATQNKEFNSKIEAQNSEINLKLGSISKDYDRMYNLALLALRKLIPPSQY
jgi:calcineurin-like phosphoesterase family protein